MCDLCVLCVTCICVVYVCVYVCTNGDGVCGMCVSECVYMWYVRCVRMEVCVCVHLGACVCVHVCGMYVCVGCI